MSLLVHPAAAQVATTPGGGPCRIESGSYTGNGATTHVISLKDATLDPYFVCVYGMDVARVATVRHRNHPAGQGHRIDDGWRTNDVKDQSVGSFTVGDSDQANFNTGNFFYFAIGPGNDNVLDVGTYEGSDATVDPQTITTGFEPGLIWLFPGGSTVDHFFIRGATVENSLQFGNDAPFASITTLPTGFTVSGPSSNATGFTYYYWALPFDTKFIWAANYFGNGSPTQTVPISGADPAFFPEWVWTKRLTAAQHTACRVVLTNAQPSDPVSEFPANTSRRFGTPNGLYVTDHIRDQTASSFIVGNDNAVNQNGIGYSAMFIKEIP